MKAYDEWSNATTSAAMPRRASSQPSRGGPAEPPDAGGPDAGDGRCEGGRGTGGAGSMEVPAWTGSCGVTGAPGRPGSGHGGRGGPVRDSPALGSRGPGIHIEVRTRRARYGTRPEETAFAGIGYAPVGRVFPLRVGRSGRGARRMIRTTGPQALPGVVGFTGTQLGPASGRPGEDRRAWREVASGMRRIRGWGQSDAM